MHERASRQNRKIAFQHVWRGGEYRKTALAIALLLAAAFVARADTVLAFSPSGTGTHATESIPTDVSLLADGVTVAVKCEMPEVGTSDMGAWLLFCAVEKGAVPDENAVSVVFPTPAL